MRHILSCVLFLLIATAALADNLPPVPPAPGGDISTLKVVAVVDSDDSKKAEAATEAVEEPAEAAPTKKALPCLNRRDTDNDDIEKPERYVARYRINRPFAKLCDELFRKPLHGVQTRLAKVDERRVQRDEARLKAEAKQLSKEKTYLDKKAKKAKGCLSQLKLMEEASDYAERANANTTARAALECRKADCRRRQKSIEATQEELYPTED
jgi:hypothetical protein